MTEEYLVIGIEDKTT